MQRAIIIRITHGAGSTAGLPVEPAVPHDKWSRLSLFAPAAASAGGAAAPAPSGVSMRA